jgi:hypothetical protein
MDMFPLPSNMGLAVDAIFLAGAIRFGLLYLPLELAAYRHHGQNAWLKNPRANQHIIDFLEFLLANKAYQRPLTQRHLALTRAKLLERKAYLSSRTGEHVLSGTLASIELPFLLLRCGLICNWRHLLLPLLCLLPLKRAGAPAKQASHAPAGGAREERLAQ